MADGLDSMELSEIVHAVQTRADRGASGITLRDAESAELPALDGLRLVGLGVVDVIGLAEEPVHAVAHAGGDVDILEQGKRRQADREVVRHAVLELVQEIPRDTAFEFRHLETDLVLQRGVITEGNLFVNLFLADTHFPFERIESTDGERDVRQREHIGAVTRILAVQGIDGKVEPSVPVLGEGYGG